MRIKIEGRSANRDAFGARGIAVAGSRRQERRVRSGGSYLSQSETTVTFGFGTVSVVDSLIVYWPGGSRACFERVPADQELRVVEGEDMLFPIQSSSTNGAPL